MTLKSGLEVTIRYDTVYLTCSKKLTGSQLSSSHGTNKKIKCETKNKKKIIQTGTTRKLRCGFLFVLGSNYGSILHHFRDQAIY